MVESERAWAHASNAEQCHVENKKLQTKQTQEINMKTTIKVYSHTKPNLDSTELEIYDLKHGVKSDSSWYTELVGEEYNSLAESLRLQGYRSKPASSTEITTGLWSIFVRA
jgi:hypothetical protein